MVEGLIPKAISLRVRGITDKDARRGSVVDFKIMGGDKGIGSTPNFTKVRNTGLTTKPKF